MRCLPGNGYQLVTITGGAWILNPGAVLVHAGEFEVGGLTLQAGDAAEVHEWTNVEGSGLLAAVGYLTDPIRQAQHYEPPTPVETVKHDKPWGWEIEVPTEAKRAQLKLIHVADGARTSLQRHEYKDETMYGVDGSWSAHYAPGQVHRLTGPVTCFEGSTYHPDDVVRLEDDYGR